ncbi:MAG: hypothetical protein A2V88_12800 [Elusimicrobia bacterium RBG_16_66_12]|nr:MAG: hypothetical protein A2V88_12800 [Elusimicrobia bacterium RBG_16_66_12]
MNSALERLRLPLAAALAALLAACSGSGDGRQAPDFSLPGLDGKTISLSSRKGRVVLVNFWATWCDSCTEELPTLREAFRRHAADPFDLLAVSVEEDAATKVPPFAAKHQLPFTILYADRKTLDSFAVRGLPASFLIAADGAIVRRYLGPLDARKLENDILTALNRRPL